MDIFIDIVIVYIVAGIVIAELCRYSYHFRTIGKFSRLLYVIIVLAWLYFLIKFIYTGVGRDEK